jgi:mRNA interferase RelE/StbE
MYSIRFKSSVEKDFSQLTKKVVTRVLAQIESLKSDPYPRQAVKLSGADELYRIRVGDYRIIYGVDTESKQIMIHYVRHRREVYRKL